MKTVMFSIITLAFYLLTVGTGIWSIVEFILYLVKDHPFYWGSLYSCIGSFFGSALAMILSIYFSATEKPSLRSKNDILKNIVGKKSNFEKRLEEMAEKRKSSTNNN